MKYYAVIDTNVIVSALLKKGSVPYQVLELMLKGIIVPLLDQRIVDEYRDVLSRNKFGFELETIEAIINAIVEKSIFVDNEKTITDFIDEDDVVFYEIVMTAREYTDAYLVTGNKKHFPFKSFVVTPREMLDIIQTNK